jgi:hypothetical protein
VTAVADLHNASFGDVGFTMSMMMVNRMEWSSTEWSSNEWVEMNHATVTKNLW